jgi:hypothetical protein
MKNYYEIPSNMNRKEYHKQIINERKMYRDRVKKRVKWIIQN